MDDGHSDPDARNLTYSLFKQIADVEPASENLKAVYPLLLEQGMQLRDQRRMRTTIATHSLPAGECFVLCIGALVTLTFTYFFRLDSFVEPEPFQTDLSIFEQFGAVEKLIP
jgi:hypothetical protein